MAKTEITEKAAQIRIIGRVLIERGAAPPKHQVMIEIHSGEDGPQHTIAITTTDKPVIEVADDTTWQLVLPF